MYLLKLVPLVKIPLDAPQALTYFSSEKVERGGLVIAPLGKKQTPAFVIESSDAREKKMEIRKEAFALKKIKTVLSPLPLVSTQQINLALWLHFYYLTPLGLAFKLFIPQSFLRRKKSLNIQAAKEYPEIKNDPTKPLLLWQENRFDFYAKEIEKSLERQKQILVLLPEVNDVLSFKKEMEKIIPEKIISLIYSGLKSSETLKEWEKIRQNETKIIIGTRSAVFAPFAKLGLIIIDQEENSSFKSWDQHPKYDAKAVAQKLAEFSGAKVILGADFPSLDSYYKAKTNQYNFLSPSLSSGFQASSSKLQVVDMKEEIRKGNFSIFSDKLRDSIIEKIRKNQQVILFINRRGLASSIFCRDCGQSLKCENCDVPMVYHGDIERKEQSEKQEKEEILICHHCGLKRKTPETCPYCHSWRIKYYGSGTEKVVQELEKIVKKESGLDLKIARLDSDIAPTIKEQEKIISDFQNKKYNILVGTQLIFKIKSALSDIRNTNLVVVLLLDPLLNLPDYRANERVFGILERLKKLGQTLLIQTYNPELSLFSQAEKEDFSDFYKEQLKERRLFHYPPFSEIIKLTYSHKNSLLGEKAAKEFKKNLEKSLDNLPILGPAPGSIPKIKNKYLWHLVLKIPSSQADPVSKNASMKIRKTILNLLPKDWEIDINPQSLL